MDFRGKYCHQGIFDMKYTLDLEYMNIAGYSPNNNTFNVPMISLLLQHNISLVAITLTETTQSRRSILFTVEIGTVIFSHNLGVL